MSCDVYAELLISQCESLVSAELGTSEFIDLTIIWTADPLHSAVVSVIAAAQHLHVSADMRSQAAYRTAMFESAHFQSVECCKIETQCPPIILATGATMVGLTRTPNHASETQINAQSGNTLATTGDQNNPVGVDFANGAAAAFFESPFSGADIDVHGTYLNGSNGVPTGAEIARPAIGFSGFPDLDPQVALLGNGGDPSIPPDRALLVWQSGPTGNTNIVGQLVDSNGQALTAAPFTVADLAGNQVTPDVVGLSNGRAAVVFADANTGNVDAEVLNTNGQSVATGPFTVGTGTAPVVTNLAGGNFVTAWVGTDIDGSGIHAQIFDQNGSKVGNELGVATNPLNVITQGQQTQASIATLSNGNFVIAWTDDSTRAGAADQAVDASGTAIKARIFNSSGVAISEELTVDTATNGNQNQPSVTAGPNGGFVVGWTDASGQADSNGTADAQGTGIKAQAFDATGAKIGGELLVNSVTAGNQDSVNLSTASDGSVLALFRDGSGQVLAGSSQTADTSGTGIQSASLTVATAGTTPTTPVPTVDTTPPNVTFDPKVTFSSTHDVTFTGTATDNKGVSGVEIFEGTKDLGPATLAQNGTWSFATNLPSDYHSDFSAVATDTSGNKSQKQPSNFDIQTGVTGEPYKSIEYLYASDGSYGYSEFSASGKLLVQADDAGNNTHIITGLANGQHIESIQNDTMTGGGSKETFIFYPHFGHEEVADFIVGSGKHDNLDLSNTHFTSATQVLNHTTMSDGSALIHVSPTDSILLDGVTKGQLKAHANDLIFG